MKYYYKCKICSVDVKANTVVISIVDYTGVISTVTTEADLDQIFSYVCYPADANCEIERGYCVRVKIVNTVPGQATYASTQITIATRVRDIDTPTPTLEEEHRWGSIDRIIPDSSGAKRYDLKLWKPQEEPKPESESGSGSGSELPEPPSFEMSVDYMESIIVRSIDDLASMIPDGAEFYPSVAADSKIDTMPTLGDCITHLEKTYGADQVAISSSANAGFILALRDATRDPFSCRYFHPDPQFYLEHYDHCKEANIVWFLRPCNCYGTILAETMAGKESCEIIKTAPSGCYGIEASSTVWTNNKQLAIVALTLKRISKAAEEAIKTRTIK